MNMRNFKSIAVVGVAVLALTACASDGGGGSDQSLRVYWATNDRAGIDAVVELYKAAHPDVDIKVDYGSNEQYQSSLRTQLQSGTAADVFYAWPGNGNPASIFGLAPEGLLADLSDSDWSADLPADLAPYTQVDGKTYLFSPVISAFASSYNQTAVDEAGLEVPTSYPELLEFCSDAKDAGKVAYAYGAQTPWNNQSIPYTTIPTLSKMTEPTLRQDIADGTQTFQGSETWHDALDQIQEMRDAGCFQDQFSGTSFENAMALVADGSALGIVGHSSLVGALAQQNSASSYSLVPFPGGPSAADTVLAAAAAAGPAVNAKAENMDLARDFVDFIASPEGLNAYATSIGGVIPTLPDTGFSMDDPNLKVIADNVAAGNTYAYLDQDWPNATVQQALQTGVQAMVSDQMTPDEVLAGMDAAYGK